MTSNELTNALHAAFAYTGDNNRDLIGDPTFTLAEVTEELTVEYAYQFLIAYIARNGSMIDANLEDIS